MCLFSKSPIYAAAVSPDGDAPKKSFWAKHEEMKRGKALSDEDIQKYAGKSREELSAWGRTQPGVEPNQLAGKVTAGATSRLGTAAAAGGTGGWGFSTEPGDSKTRGTKFRDEGGGPGQVG